MTDRSPDTMVPLIGPDRILRSLKVNQAVIIMQAALRMETTVLPGHRLEVSSPELPEGARVEVIVVLPQEPKKRFASALEFLESLPPGPRAFPTWEEYERFLREEKEAWE